MKKSTLVAAVGLALGATTASAVTFNFGNTTTAGVNGVDFNFTTCANNFLAGKEFRMCDPDGALGGGLPTQKDTMNGTETWSFDAGGLLTGTTNTANTGGLNATVAYYVDIGAVAPSSDRDGGVGLDQGADFFSNGFGFLATTVGSQSATAGVPNANDIGLVVPTYTATGAGTFELFFPILEAQWAGTHFGLGAASGGIVFHGTTDGTNFSMWAEETIDSTEDYGGAGFANWTAQWYLNGTIDGFVPPTPAVPIPAAAWLFGSGLLGLVGIARRKKATA